MSQIEHLPSLEKKGEPQWRRYLSDSAMAVMGSLLVTTIIYTLHFYPSIPNISLVYLLVVLVLASTRGLYAAVLSALVAFFSFDFFLVPPLYTFTIARPEEWVALFVFLATAIITGQLASALHRRAEQASRQAREMRILYELVRATNDEEELERQLSVVVHAVVDVFSSWGVRDCAILLPNEGGKNGCVQSSCTCQRQHYEQIGKGNIRYAWVEVQCIYYDGYQQRTQNSHDAIAKIASPL